MDILQQLYRGFRAEGSQSPDEIIWEGKKIRGRWLYWNIFGQRCNKDGELEGGVIARSQVVEETISQLVERSEDGRNFFVGDIIYEEAENATFELVYENNSYQLKLIDYDNKSRVGQYFSIVLPLSSCKILRNKWEEEN